MNNEFVNFELAQKLKENGFSCKYPFAMYDECGKFHPLYTSADYYKAPSGFEYRCYYDFDDFKDEDTFCPTIEQVLTWLRTEKKIHIIISASYEEDYWWEVRDFNRVTSYFDDNEFDSYEQAALAGIEYVIEKFI